MNGIANNVRIRGDVRVLSENITHELNKPNVATFSFTVEWDNSWRDKFNYDAVYVFLKHKVRGDGELWYNVYLQDKGNSVSSDDYILELENNQGRADHNEGFFLYRKANGQGTSSVTVTLQWNIQSTDRPGSLRIADFEDGRVLLSAMGIEMVYVPRGAFRIGDTYSANHFRNNYLPLPEKYDIIPYARSFRSSSILGGPLYADPVLAANRVNDISTELNPETGFPTNAWYGDREGDDDRNVGSQYWACYFSTPRIVKYLAIESVPGYVPASWELQGQSKQGAIGWETIYRGTAKDWETALVRTYPPTRSFRVNTDNKSYYNYRIYIKQSDMPGGMSGNPPLIKNIAMAEADLANVVDNSVLIHEPVTTLGTLMGLAAGDSDAWSGKTDVDYPNGYPAFYTMKYEVSQEQYVSFLNKLTIRQQRGRTIGADLDKLREGEYVFGSSRTASNCRNGVILLKKSNGSEPAIFEARREAGKTDGTLACNYLSPADMLAYADWCGLRPLTEMEYEKMCRPFYPTETNRGDFPWTSNRKTAAVSMEQPATRFEHPANAGANVNFGGNIQGPVRCGAFLAKATVREQSGASFWGVMEAGGNLAEIYYNVNSDGRLFRGLSAGLHGDGYLSVDGLANVGDNKWPVLHNAFILKGGHWADRDEKLLAVSDRSRFRNNYQNMNITRRDSTVTFRLGHTARQTMLRTDISLQNGLSTASAGEGQMIADTVCAGDIYTIRGSLPEEMRGKLFSVVWYKSENKGVTWEPVEGTGDQSLVVTKLQNINTNEDVVLEYWFKKEIYGEMADAKSGVVVLKVLNSKTKLNRTVDTLDVYDHSLGVRINVHTKAEFAWLFNGRAADISYDVQPSKPEKSEVGAPLYSSLSGAGVFYVIRSRFMKQCITNDTIRVHRLPEPLAQLSDAADWRCGNIMVDARDGRRYRTFFDGKSCWMADNLNYMASESRCYDGKAANCDAYGRLYNWKQAVGQWDDAGSVKGVCPAGWHIPSYMEWLAFSQAVTEGGSGWRSQRNLWIENVQKPHVFSYDNLATNSSRFSALPGGGYFFSYSTDPKYGSVQLPRVTGYYDQGQRAWWWSSTGVKGSYVTNSSVADAQVIVPMYASVNYKNEAAATATVQTSIFYGPVQYLGNGTAINGDSKYYATVALQNNFYFSVRCIKDLK